MKRTRVIPVLLLHNNGLVKSENFKNYRYVGDPINAVKIFNEKEVDELAIIDIGATRERRKPNIQWIREIAGEAFMPLAYGGGITQIEEVREILFNGIEKVIINKSAVSTPELITQIADRFGRQSITVSIDVKKNFWGKYRVYTNNGSHSTDLDPVAFAQRCEELGAGEILLNAIEKDGTYKGYDLDILKRVSAALDIPVIACGGAGNIDDFRLAVTEGQASAVAAGSMFVFQRPHNAVLISYPSQTELKEKFYNKLSDNNLRA
ncbi:MAG: AglZ/HisF2 family acetamidino modification protein [Pseudobacter sp.]|uniref:AglZ/HisF2 family acetamidino modification protein n=1 Tax=Pseudobacter sp. TaxID=2045420 RepID=UPI003F803851